MTTLSHHEHRITTLAAGRPFTPTDVVPMLRKWALDLSTDVSKGIGSGDWLLQQGTRARLLNAAADALDRQPAAHLLDRLHNFAEELADLADRGDPTAPARWRLVHNLITDIERGEPINENPGDDAP